jgi:hypothetical protein
MSEQLFDIWAFACTARTLRDSLSGGVEIASAFEARASREETQSRRHGLA